MSLFDLKGKLEKTARDSQSTFVLQTVWIKIHGLPALAKEAEAVKEVASLAAEPLVVDELSLIRDEPARVQGRCRNPGAINGGSIEISFNGVGKLITFEVEGNFPNSNKRGGGGPPSSGKPDDKQDKKDRDNQDKQGGGKFKKSAGKFDRIGKMDRGGDSSQEDSMEAVMDIEPNESVPLTAYHPDLGLIKDPFSFSVKKGKEILEQEEGEMVELQYDPKLQMVVQGRDGPYMMDKSKWLTLILTEEEEATEVLTQEITLTDKSLADMGGGLVESSKRKGSEEDIMDADSIISKSDVEELSRGWTVSKPKAKKKRSSKKVVVATRASSRISKDGISIADKATARVMAKNTITGMTKNANPFTILNNVTDSALLATLGDLNVTIDETDAQIGVFRAEELARVALAKANYKNFLKKQFDREKPVGEDVMGEISLSIIDNSSRLGKHDDPSELPEHATKSPRGLSDAKTKDVIK